MHLLQFGSSQKRLFGVYHAPEGPKGSRGGIVLCQPHGHEYVRAHRSLRNLAVRLSGAGVHVLRFDYFGTGDSAGDSDAGTFAQWQQDVGSAIDELKDMGNLSRVSLVGVRLGATLAALAASSRKDVDALVLWDPIVRGAAYVKEQLDLQSQWLDTRRWVKVPAAYPDGREIIGFPLTPELEAELNAVDLLGVTRWPAKRTLVVTSRGVDAAPLEAHLAAQGVANVGRRVDGDCEWLTPTSVHLTLLANELSEAISGYFLDKGAA